jgi:hypothetical protein
LPPYLRAVAATQPSPHLRAITATTTYDRPTRPSKSPAAQIASPDFGRPSSTWPPLLKQVDGADCSRRGWRGVRPRSMTLDKYTFCRWIHTLFAPISWPEAMPSRCLRNCKLADVQNTCSLQFHCLVCFSCTSLFVYTSLRMLASYVFLGAIDFFHKEIKGYFWNQAHC